MEIAAPGHAPTVLIVDRARGSATPSVILLDLPGCGWGRVGVMTSSF
jgi:hypothetical protein